MNNQLTRQEVIDLTNEIVTAYNDTNPKYKYKVIEEFTQAVEDTRYYRDNIPDFQVIEKEGGEGEGDYAYHVILWKGLYYKFVYSYHSYDGFCFDYADVYRVTPKEKTIIVYE